MLDATAGSIACRFQARDLNLVLAPPPSGAPGPFGVLLDGRPPADAHGLYDQLGFLPATRRCCNGRGQALGSNQEPGCRRGTCPPSGFWGRGIS